ncbi:MAG: hypothetical protein MJ000_02405 [Bacteroidales bacterium]|nr:hypothetical protein [Bacteroidales bacterium]
MKKLTLALMCLVGVLFMTSCSKDDDDPKLPTIEFVNAGEGYVYQNTEVYSGDMVGFQIKAIATDANDLLTSLYFKVIYNNEVLGDTTITLDKLTTYTFTAEPEPMDLPGGLVTVEATVKTKKNNTATAKVNITVLDATLEVNDLSWVRVGGTPGTGLEQFGLEWKSNVKEVKAKIVPVEGAELKILEGVEFASITTEVGKKNAFESATPAEKFHEVSCEANKDYNFVIMTQYNDNLYLINVKKGTVEKQPDNSMKITITGQWK